MKMEWIKCVEGKMPEDILLTPEERTKRTALNVLVTTNSGIVTKVQRVRNYSNNRWYWGRLSGTTKCRAWMILPKPYKDN